MKRFAKAAMGAAALSAAGAWLGCSQILGLDGDPVLRSSSAAPGGAGGSGGGTTTGSGPGGSGCGDRAVVSEPFKIDILLSIDNSRSMADKQAILTLAIPDLLARFKNPLCIGIDGLPLPLAEQPLTGFASCPAGSKRELPASQDIHVGIVTSSLGGYGSDACAPVDSLGCAAGEEHTSNDDHGQLVTRRDPCKAGVVPTYQGKGFLAWDPLQKADPPGEASPGVFDQRVKDLVLGAGQIGCGYEAPLESWYRFLVDPAPYGKLELDENARISLSGTDTVLLQQRADFLRPDSLLAVIMLSDENDCSIRAYGNLYYALQQHVPSKPGLSFHLPRARQECATDPNDPCCMSCGMSPGACPPDPSCAGDPTLDAKSDDGQLRCWDQKRRFGIDFLHPIDRYVTGLTSPMVPDRAGNVVPNPIFAGGRDCNLVTLAGIIGVPWQDVARDAKDLSHGYMSAEELAAPQQGVTRWDIILGDPSSYTWDVASDMPAASHRPKDPHMIELDKPRSGTNPVTGDTLAPPSSQPGQGPDAISGHEYTPGLGSGFMGPRNDLEYACIFPLSAPRDCTLAQQACDCEHPDNDNPLCEPDTTKGGDRTLQARAKAYPGLRQLSVLKALGPHGVVASICAVQYDDPTRADYGYRPAVEALLAQVASRIAAE